MTLNEQIARLRELLPKIVQCNQIANTGGRRYFAINTADSDEFDVLARNAMPALLAQLGEPVTCGCGDIRWRGDMCHICGKCQMGCCMCADELERRRAHKCSARIGEEYTRPTFTIEDSEF